MDEVNGTGQVSLIRTVIQVGPTQVKLIWTQPDGAYVGELIYTALSPVALRAMVSDFGQFVVQATSGLLIAGAVPSQPSAKLS